MYTILENYKIKDNARNFIRGRLWPFWQIILVTALISGALNIIPDLIFGDKVQGIRAVINGSGSIPRQLDMGPYYGYYILRYLFTFLTIPLTYGFFRNASLWVRGVDESKWDVLFSGYKSVKFFFKMVWLYLLTSVLIVLWTLLLIVPGIIKALAYSYAPLILYDEPELTAWEAIKKSRDITKGYKGRMFLLGLSFIGWLILGVFTFGILYIWLYPYIVSSFVIMYDELRRAFYQGADPAGPRSASGEQTPDDSKNEPGPDDTDNVDHVDESHPDEPHID